MPIDYNQAHPVRKRVHMCYSPCNSGKQEKRKQLEKKKKIAGDVKLRPENIEGSGINITLFHLHITKNSKHASMKTFTHSVSQVTK